MPKIPKLERKPRKQLSEKSKIRQKFYQTSEWRSLRLSHLMLHPLCEDCLEKGIVRSAIDVHHIQSPFNTDNLLQQKDVGLDPNNLRSLCKECHGIKHGNRGKNNKTN